MNSVLKKNYGIILACCMLLVAKASPLPFVEAFELEDGITSGALHDQNGWVTTGGTADVQSTTVESGLQAVEIQSSSIAHDLSSSNSAAWFHFQLRCEEAPTANSSVTAPNTSLAFFVNTNLNIVVYSNTIPVELSTQIQLNTWTRFDIYCDYDDLYWDLSMDGANIVAGLPLYSTNTQIKSIIIGNESPSSGYIDQIDISGMEKTAVGLPDTDGDGIPDWWEQKHFDGVTSVIAAAPSENDGLTYLQAYIAGVSPTVFEPFAVSLVPGGNGLSWTPVPSRLYSVYWTTNLMEGFTFLQGGIPYPESEYIDSAHSEEATGFYRLYVETEESEEDQRLAGQRILQEISASYAAGNPEFTVPPGTYRFKQDAGSGSSSIIQFKNFADFRIIANNATFVMEDWKTGIYFKENDNLAVEGLTIDYDPLPYTQGTIVQRYRYSGGAAYIVVDTDEGFPDPELIAAGTSDLPIIVMSATDQKIKLVEWGSKSITKISSTRFRIDFNLPKYPYPAALEETYFHDFGIVDGDRVVMLRRTSYAAVLTHKNEALSFSNINIHSSPGLAFTTLGNASTSDALEFINCNIVRKPGSSRLLSANADGFHIANTKGPLLIENCEVEYIGDDAVNVRGTMGVYLGQDDPYTHYLSLRQNYNNQHLFQPGERLSVFPSDYSGPRQALTIASATSSSSSYYQNISDNVKNELGVRIWDYSVYKVISTQPVSANAYDFVLDEDAARSSSMEISGNNFHDLVGKIRIQSRYGDIKNNTLKNLGTGGIFIGLHLDWLEGTYVSNMVVSGNTLKNCVQMRIEKDLKYKPYVAAITAHVDKTLNETTLPTQRLIGSLVIENNTLDTFPTTGIFVGNTDDAIIRNNTLIKPANMQTTHAGGGEFDGNYSIIVHGTTGTRVINGNVVQDKPLIYPGEVLEL